MQLVDFGPMTAAEHVAGDEALLDWAEDQGPISGLLRIWEPTEPVVVVGRSSRASDEVDLDECERRRVPILRRSSGGAAIVGGPGCLMYAVVLGFAERPWLRSISAAHAHVLGHTREAVVRALQTIGPEPPAVLRLGISDLALAQPENRPLAVGTVRQSSDEDLPSVDEVMLARKFSGNSLRVRRTHLLYHGTLLYEFDLALVGRLLRSPPREPNYRGGRDHADFVTNLPLSADSLRTALIEVWGAAPTETAMWPEAAAARIKELVAQRYGQRTWNIDGRR